MTIRFGIIGTGAMATGHARRIHNHKDAELAALCDVEIGHIQAFLERAFPPDQAEKGPSPRMFESCGDMFEEAELDAVLIATPHTMHFEHGMQALAANCHVYMEKPMVTHTKQACALSKEAALRNRILVVGFNSPCTPAFFALREAIRSNRLGKLELVSGYLSQGWMKATLGTWRQNPELSGGGQAYDSGAHLLNSLVWSVESAPALVSAFLDFHGTPVDVNSAINIRFQNGVLASIAIGGNCPRDASHLAYMFEEGKIDVDGWCGTWLKAWKGSEEVQLPGLEAPKTDCLSNFVDAILGRAEPRTSPQNGINQSALMDAIYESASSGSIVTVPPPPENE